MSMHTPAVLTFLHLLSAGLMQLLLVAWGAVPAPHVSAAAAKGALEPAAVCALQVWVCTWSGAHTALASSYNAVVIVSASNRTHSACHS
jgi:hypothetical protein